MSGPISGETSRNENFLRQLLATNDVTQALRLAVDYAVEALRCDVSWAALVHNDRLVMSAHRGLRSAEMASAWQLRIGEGIGGRVASERRSHMSRDYRHDSRRVPLMKRLIDNEGIQATLTVPLLMAEVTLGVLYAAQRRPHPWTVADLALLEGVGRDLAIRLRQLDVDGRREARARDAENRVELAAESQRAAGRAAIEMSLEPGIEGGLSVIAQQLHCSVALHGTQGLLLMQAGHEEAGKQHSAQVLPLQGTDGYSLVLRRPEAQHDNPATDRAELLAAIFALHLLRVRERVVTLEQVNGQMIDQLLTGRITDEVALHMRLSILGITPSRCQVWVVTDRDADATRLAAFVDLIQEIAPRYIDAMRTDHLAVLLDSTEVTPAAMIRRAEQILSRPGNEHLIIGVGRECSHVRDCAMSYDQARAAIELGLKQSLPGKVLSAREMGILTMASVPTDYLRSTVDDVLGPLIEADEVRGTELVKTLDVYLSNDRHLPSTAASLHVHYNTVRNRILRVEGLLGVDVSNVGARFQLQTALRMYALVRPTDPR